MRFYTIIHSLYFILSYFILTSPASQAFLIYSIWYLLFGLFRFHKHTVMYLFSHFLIFCLYVVLKRSNDIVWLLLRVKTLSPPHQSWQLPALIEYACWADFCSVDLVPIYFLLIIIYLCCRYSYWETLWATCQVYLSWLSSSKP